MSLINIFVRGKYHIADFSFDAVLSDETELSAEITSYPLESGAQISEHKIVQPIRYRISGINSNTPLNVINWSLAGGFASNFVSDKVTNIASPIAGLSSAFLSGSKDSVSAGTWDRFIDFIEKEETLEVTAGEIILKDMCVTKVVRNRDPENENAFAFELELQEVIRINRISDKGTINHQQLKKNSPESKGITGIVDRGKQMLQDVSSSISKSVEDKVNSVKEVFK